MTEEPMLAARALMKEYDEGRIQALRGVDLQIAPGEFLTISGPSGSGKSTLLQLLGGLDEPSSGEVLYRGASLAGRFDLDAYRSRRVGFVFQAFHLLPALRVLDNVQIPMLEGRLNAQERRTKAAALLEEVGMTHRTRQYPNQLSAGERQRVAIARSLANDPEILLGDEPTGNLDSENSAKIMALLSGIQAQRSLTIVLVTHEAEVARMGHRNVHMKDGRVVA
ncbi:MAG TPA: ABC transporter ATP-binding protein [Bryobacteraceae bacterium]|nr:ABC transporter ATP-binding protein [Bryobacteraceae bacterium]